MKNRDLPPRCYWKNGAYWHVRRNKWTRLGKTWAAAGREYERLERLGDGGLDEIIDLLLTDAAESCKASTLSQYRTAGDKIRAAFAEFRPDQVKPTDVAQFMQANRSIPNMANRMRTVLKMAFDKAVLLGIAPTNPVTSVPRLKEKKRTRYITDQEYRAIQAKAAPLLAAVIEVCLLTGQRIGDVLKMRRTDLDEVGIFVEQEKTGARLRIGWSKGLREAVAQAKALAGVVKGIYLLGNSRGGKVSYYTIRDQWDKATAAAGVEDAHLHDLRAKAGTDTKAGGGDSKALLGHKSESSHARYLRGLEIPVVEATRRKAS